MGLSRETWLPSRYAVTFEPRVRWRRSQAWRMVMLSPSNAGTYIGGLASWRSVYTAPSGSWSSALSIWLNASSKEGAGDGSLSKLGLGWLSPGTLVSKSDILGPPRVL